MSTKSFKKLPKRAQRAAFAEMDDSGTRRKDVPVKKLTDGGKTMDRATRKVLDPQRLPDGMKPASKAQIEKRKQSLRTLSGFSGTKLSAGPTAKKILKSLKK